jgi:hypothetical protein
VSCRKIKYNELAMTEQIPTEDETLIKSSRHAVSLPKNSKYISPKHRAGYSTLKNKSIKENHPSLKE